jgi:hypothetical protein
MGRLEDSYHLRVQARSLCLMARSAKIAAREVVDISHAIRRESQELLKYFQASRLHGPLPKSTE